MNIYSIISILVFYDDAHCFPWSRLGFLLIMYIFDMVNIIFSNFIPSEFIIYLLLNTTLFFTLGSLFCILYSDDCILCATLLTLTLLSGLFYKDNLFDRVNIEKGIF